MSTDSSNDCIIPVNKPQTSFNTLRAADVRLPVLFSFIAWAFFVPPSGSHLCKMITSFIFGLFSVDEKRYETFSGSVTMHRASGDFRTGNMGRLLCHMTMRDDPTKTLFAHL